MKALLTTFAVLAIKATTAPYVAEYNENNVRAINAYLSVKGPEREATLINSNAQILFKQRETRELDAFHLVFESLTRPGNENTCERSIGIRLDNGQEHYCSISRFGVEVDYDYENKELAKMRFIVLFQCKSQPTVLIEIPVFKIPSWVRRKNLSTWSEAEHVGFLSPLSKEQLSTLDDSQQAVLDFTWLSDLLRHKIRNGKNFRVVDGEKVDLQFVARPIVLSKKILRKLMDQVERFKRAEDSIDEDSSGSSCSDVAGFYARE